MQLEVFRLSSVQVGMLRVSPRNMSSPAHREGWGYRGACVCEGGNWYPGCRLVGVAPPPLPQKGTSNAAFGNLDLRIVQIDPGYTKLSTDGGIHASK